MRRISMKMKVTLWFTCLMIVMAALSLGAILTVSGTVAARETMEELSAVVRGNLSLAGLNGRQLDLSPDFKFYSEGVYILVYNKEGAVLAGQTPLKFPAGVPLENGVTKTVGENENVFYVFDLWRPVGWEDGIWLRGVIPSPSSNQMVSNILTMFAIIFPPFILLAAIGGYFLSKRALNPIDRIIEAAGEITEGKDLSKRIGLPKGSDEASRLGAAFDSMFERLETAFEAEKQFTSDASHELRTPTAVILSQCGFTRKHGENLEDYQEAIEVIERQAEKMSVLINRLLDITRLDQGTQKIVRENTDLSQLVTILCEEQQEGKRGIHLSWEIQPEIMAWVDVFLYSRVFQNLVDNGYKYGRENGIILVKLKKQNGFGIFSVTDDGPGINPEDQEKIWQRFYQVEASRGEGTGLGLGLSMVRQIAGLHGGKAWVESVPGKGSTFFVSVLVENRKNESY